MKGHLAGIIFKDHTLGFSPKIKVPFENLQTSVISPTKWYQTVSLFDTPHYSPNYPLSPFTLHPSVYAGGFPCIL